MTLTLGDRREVRCTERGPPAVVVKGLLDGDRSVDVLWKDGECVKIESELVKTKSTAELAKDSKLEKAVRRAKLFVASALASAPGLGSGIGPVNHHASPAT